MVGNAPVSSAIQVGFPAASKATATGSANAAAETAAKPATRPCSVSETGATAHALARLLMEAEPATFHITPHYKDYPSVLARIGTLHPGSLYGLLERRWRKIAPKAAVKAFQPAKIS